MRGLVHVPVKGGLVIAANHASFLDPLMCGCAVAHRQSSYLARDDLFRVPVFGTLIRLVNALPVRRGVFSRELVHGLVRRIQESGLALVIFPEGTRSEDGRLGVPKRGVGAICREAGVPVVPARILGTFEVWPRSRRLPRLLPGRIEVRFGPPVQWSEEELNASGDPNGALASLIMKRISELDHIVETPLGFWQGLSLIIRQPGAASPSPGGPGCA